MFSYLVLEFLCNQDGDKSVRCRILLCTRPIFFKQMTSHSQKIFQENSFSSTPNFAGSNSKYDSTPCNLTGSQHDNIDVVHPSSQVVHQSSQIPTTEYYAPKTCWKVLYQNHTSTTYTNYIWTYYPDFKSLEFWKLFNYMSQH